MLIGGIQPVTLSDYPGRIASIVFTVGCNFRCPYCYNAPLVVGRGVDFLSTEEVIERLERRKRFVKAVVVTGGEPTIHGDSLVDFVRRLYELGYNVKLDTNGSNPSVVKSLVPYIDYCSLDIKTDEDRYPQLGGDFKTVIETLDILRGSGKNYEVRIPVVPNFVDEDMLNSVKRFLKPGEKVVLKEFVNCYDMIDPKFKEVRPYHPIVVKRFAEILDGFSVSLL